MTASACPTLRLDKIDFAAGTPYENAYGIPPARRRTRTAWRGHTGRPGNAGACGGRRYGKTPARRLHATGRLSHHHGRKDRHGRSPASKRTARGGVVLSSRVVSRSGTLVFYIGDRHFGTLTAYVAGPEAAKYKFTSALPAQILKALAPKLINEINRPEQQGTACPGS